MHDIVEQQQLLNTYLELLSFKDKYDLCNKTYKVVE